MKPLMQRHFKSGANLLTAETIGDKMHQLYKDDYLYDKEVILNPNFKLQSLRDMSAFDLKSQIVCDGAVDVDGEYHDDPIHHARRDSLRARLPQTNLDDHLSQGSLYD